VTTDTTPTSIWATATGIITATIPATASGTTDTGTTDTRGTAAGTSITDVTATTHASGTTSTGTSGRISQPRFTGINKRLFERNLTRTYLGAFKCE